MCTKRKLGNDEVSKKKNKCGFAKVVRQILIQLPIIGYYLIVLVKDILDLSFCCLYKLHSLYILKMKMHFLFKKQPIER